jgi:predicted small metal-binding protein
MPTIACRDAGLDCDWFFRADEPIEVIVASLQHEEDQHMPTFKDILKRMSVSEWVSRLRMMMKP